MKRNIVFKAPRSLEEIKKLNAGLFYGFSQVGKIFTIYPTNETEAVSIAEELCELTGNVEGPPVSFDRHFAGPIYYRYGVMQNTAKSAKTKSAKTKSAKTKSVRDLSHWLRKPNGKLIKDRREPGHAIPTWLNDPFESSAFFKPASDPLSKLNSRYLAYKAYMQRGKGGVYTALDIGVLPAKNVVLKEGRHLGEVDIDGNDGQDLILHEMKVLKHLRKKGVAVPQVKDFFTAGKNNYLVLEKIEGKTLQEHLKGVKRLPLPHALTIGYALAELVASIHYAGWVWRDCKPSNCVYSKQKKLIALDFEGASCKANPDPRPWGTTGYSPPEWLDDMSGDRVPEDLHALGASLHQIISGRTPQKLPFQPIKKLRKDIPRPVEILVTRLLSKDPAKRPSARSAAVIMKVAKDSLHEFKVSQIPSAAIG